MNSDDKNKEHGLDPIQNTAALQRRKRLASGDGRDLQQILGDLRLALKTNPSPEEAATLRKRILAAEKTQQNLDGFHAQVALSMAAGGKPVRTHSTTDLRALALRNYAEANQTSLHMAQLKMDELLSSGNSQDMAELVRWSEKHIVGQGDEEKPNAGQSSANVPAAETGRDVFEPESGR